MRLPRLLALAVFVALPVDLVVAAPVDPSYLGMLAKGCKVVKKVQRTYSADGRLRAEYITFCAGKNGENVIWFEAAAMHNDTIVGSHAPYMSIELRDRRFRTLWKDANAFQIDVPGCGGYEFHWHRLPGDLPGAVYDMRVSIQKIGLNRCDRKNDLGRDIVRIAAQVIRAQKDCRDPKAGLNEEEVTVCEFAKKNGVTFGGGKGKSG